MADYIEREAAKLCVKEHYDDAIIIALDKLPAADVVPVVRCKDCRHIHTGKDVYYCRYWERWGITPNGFCSSGAKMYMEEDK